MTEKNPASDDYRLRELEERHELFEAIRDDEDLPQQIRDKYGQKPLELIDELQRRQGR